MGNKGVSRRGFMKLASAATAGVAFDWDGALALAKGIGDKSKNPVVVVGGGMGGLSAAAVLARQGFPVTLLEQHDRPGGYATSFDRAAGKYTFEVSLHATGTAQGGVLKDALEAAGVLLKTKTAEMPELCRIVNPRHDLLWPRRDPQAVVKQLGELFPKEREGIASFFGYMESILDEAMKPFDPDSWLDKIIFPLTHRKMWNLRNKTLGDVLDDHVGDTQVRSLLSAFWGYFGLPPSKLSGFLYVLAIASFIRFGGHYFKDRSQDLSYNLMEVIEQSGGRVRLETKVEKIRTEKGRISGVELAGGEKIPARVVVSNASIPATLELVEKGDPGLAKHDKARKFIKKMKSLSPSLSTFLVFLGLNREIRGKIPGYEIFMEQTLDTEESYQASLACDPDKALIAVTVYDNLFKGYSKPGTSTVVLLILSGYEPWKKFEADYRAGNKEAYNQEKERIARVLIEKTEKRVVPGLSSMIEVVETATPLTNIRYTGNPGGAICGFEYIPKTTYINRIGCQTPVKGLYLSSAWSHGGGFQPALGAGLDAAKNIIKDLGMEYEKKEDDGKPVKV